MRYGCVILAGGKSLRMKKDKALLKIYNTTFIDCLTSEFDCFEEKLISRGKQSALIRPSWQLLDDIYHDIGPVGGLHAALVYCESEALFTVSCDMPLVKKELADSLISMLTDDIEAVVVKDKTGRIHPLCAVYRKSILPIVEEQIKKEDYRMQHLLDKLNVCWCMIEDDTMLKNINTPEEYQLLNR